MPIKTKTIPALEARTQLWRIMKDVHDGRVRVLVEKSGVPMVAIISADEFRRAIAERETRFEVIDRIRRRLPPESGGAVEQNVRAALAQIRRRRHACRRPVTRAGRARMSKRLQEGAVRRAGRDRALAEDWVLLGGDVWRRRGR